MKLTTRLLMILGVILLASCNQTGTQEPSAAEEPSEAPQRDYFQLKIYHFDTAEQEASLDAYFQDALLPALHRTGIEHVGVFKPVEGLSEQEDFIMVLIPFHSLDAFDRLPGQLQEDEAYQQAGKAYIDAPHDTPPYSRIETVILKCFSATPRISLPDLTSPRSERVYELRSYESATEKLYNLKVEMFNEGESDLFQDLNFNPVFFGEVLSSAHMPHLMYMIAHADTTAQRENWAAFGSHPEWERMSNLERYQNTVSNITRYLMYPTAYSDY